MILVGLAGQIGVGKSTVASMLAQMGAVVIDADRVAHEVLETPSVRDAIATRFGNDLLDGEGRVCRPALAALVFGPTPHHTAALDALEAIVHPLVREQMQAEIEVLRQAAGSSAADLVIVLDVPLLVQSGWAAACDRILEVVCEAQVRHRRLRARGWSPQAIAWRDAAWQRKMPAGGVSTAQEAARIRTVDTSGAISYTQQQVEQAWQWLRT